MCMMLIILCEVSLRTMYANETIVVSVLHDPGVLSCCRSMNALHRWYS